MAAAANATAAVFASAGSGLAPMGMVVAEPSCSGMVAAQAGAAVAYVIGSCSVYCKRQGVFCGQQAKHVFRHKVRKPEDMTRLSFSMAFLGWVSFLLAYPLAEPLAALFGHSLFWFYYPNANGAGLVIQPLGTARQEHGRRVPPNIRLDWHELMVGTGPRVPKGNGFGPPKRMYNLPHLNSPGHQLRGWPWRQNPWLLGPWRYERPGEVAREQLHIWLRRRAAARELFMPSATSSSSSSSARKATSKKRREDATTAALSPDPSWPLLSLTGRERIVRVPGSDGDFEALVAEALELVDRASGADGGRLRVAMDAEWGADAARPLALLQIAFEAEGDAGPTVFLLDMHLRHPPSTLELVRRLLLPAPGVGPRRHRVLGFSPRQDLRRLVAAGVLPAELDGVAAEDLGWTDLQLLDAVVLEVEAEAEAGALGASDDAFVPAPAPGQHRGLRDVVRRRLGQDLDKRMQRSNWDLRPLSRAQLDYAALDAVCLLWVFAALPAD